ncbi:MAG: ATP-grasp domain-containing protein [Nitrospira sp.]|nr:MAG: ATP-grasp domain-containing protein [Nitrospira sp.]
MTTRITGTQAGKKDFLDVAAISKAEVERLLKTAALLKDKQRRGILHPLLPGKTLGLLFQKPSTRTRVSFEAGMNQLGTGALIERYIEGREFYVGVMGNGHAHVLPVWELMMDKLPDDARRIATERVKWSRTYQDKYGIRSGEARNLPEGKAEKIQHLAKRVYRTLGLSGYARIDVRMDAEEQVYVLEANPNPQIAHDEDFSDSAEKDGYTYKDLLQELLNIGLRWRPAKAA